MGRDKNEDVIEFEEGDWVLHANKDLYVVTESRPRRDQMWCRRIGSADALMYLPKNMVELYLPDDNEYRYDSVMLLQRGDIIKYKVFQREPDKVSTTYVGVIQEGAKSNDGTDARMCRVLLPMVNPTFIYSAYASPLYIEEASEEEKIDLQIAIFKR